MAAWLDPNRLDPLEKVGCDSEWFQMRGDEIWKKNVPSLKLTVRP